jgi:hypothetical protein
MRKTIGIVLIYAAAVLILFAIMIMFDLIPFAYGYTVAAVGFTCYIAGMFLAREGRFSAYTVAMIVVGLLLVAYALFREVMG